MIKGKMSCRGSRIKRKTELSLPADPDLYLELEEGHRHLTGEAEAIWRYLSQIIQDNRQRESC